MKLMAMGYLSATLIALGSGLGGAAETNRDFPPPLPSVEQNDRVGPVMKIVVLGSGTPVPSRTQAGTAVLVEAGGRHFLFDCGRGCTTRLAQYDSVLLTRIDKLFLTHLHSDHVVGIPDLWLNGWTQGRATPFSIWGPAGTDAMMEGMRSTYAADIGYRLPPDSGDPEPLTVKTRLISNDGAVYDQNGVTITAFRVHHADIPAYGYRIDYAGKSVVLSGDTSVTPNLAIYGKGADVALLEVASPTMVEYVQRSFPRAQAEIILALHMTAGQAAKTFAAIKPKLGVYYHMVSNCSADKALMAETRKRYRGPLAISRDLTEIDVMRDSVQIKIPSDEGGCDG